METAKINRFLTALSVSALVILVLASELIVPAQTKVADFRKMLQDDVAFGDADFAAIDNGEVVVKSVPREDKREVAVCGVVRLQNFPDMSLVQFRESLSQKNIKTMLANGRFSSPPAIEDIQLLTLEDRDIEDMKKCTVGKCDLNMSASMIKRLQTEIDWNSPDYRSQVTQLFQGILVDYVTDYASRGDQALLQLDNRKVAVRLDDDHREMLDETLFLQKIAPEFAKYLKNFPRVELAGTESSIGWSKVNFGLKPFLTINQTASYTFNRDGFSQFLVATKGIYASRYLDSSLALSMLVRLPTKTASETYLVFTNISRSDSLSGLFGGFKRDVVSKESESRVMDVLQRAKLRLETSAKGPIDLDPPSGPSDWTIVFWALASNRFVQVLVLLLFGGILILTYRKLRA